MQGHPATGKDGLQQYCGCMVEVSGQLVENIIANHDLLKRDFLSFFFSCTESMGAVRTGGSSPAGV